MDLKKIGTRGFLFTFYELKNSEYDCVTNIYAINGKNYFFICDTYLGPYYIKKVKNYLETSFGKKQYVVFNSHSHWDHIWGNCMFENSMIISHEKCREFILTNGKEELTEHMKQFAKENIKIILPNFTFNSKLNFTDEGLEFFYSPGHTKDSASCYDYSDNTLFVGDNIDDPIPCYICSNDLNEYKNTLEKYLSINACNIIQSHGEPAARMLIEDNINYLKKLISNESIKFDNPEALKKHLINLECLKL